jgi:hypothetical protein
MEQKGPTEICWKLILEMAGAEAWAEDKAGAEAGAEAKASAEAGNKAPFHFDLIWAFLGCVFGSIQIVLDSSFTIVGSPFWESCLVPL